MNQHAKSKKDFEAARLGVFAIPGLLLTHFELRNPGLKSKGTAKVKANQSEYFGVTQEMLGNSILRTSVSVLKKSKLSQSPQFKDAKFFAKVEG